MTGVARAAVRIRGSRDHGAGDVLVLLLESPAHEGRALRIYGCSAPRARQNVVLEMGMVLSALRRPNVAILKKGHIEIPSDVHGIIYIPFNDHVNEVAGKHDLMFGPDPSTHEYCTIGGNVGNNSCGTHSVHARVEGNGSRTSDFTNQ